MLMTLVDQQQRPWKLSLRAKAKNLDLKVEFSRIIPLCKFQRFSIQFKLHRRSFQIESKPKSSFSLQLKSLKLKFLEIFKNFHRKRSENKGIVRSWCVRKNYIYKGRKIGIWLCILLFAMVGCSMITQLSYCLGGRFVSRRCWTAWNYAAPSGLLYQFSKVIFDEICQSIGF